MDADLRGIVRRAFDAGRMASKHYQTLNMTNLALEPIEADLSRLVDAAREKGRQSGIDSRPLPEPFIG